VEVFAWVRRQLVSLPGGMRTHISGVRSAALAIRGLRAGGSIFGALRLAVVKRSKDWNAGQTSRGIPLTPMGPLTLSNTAHLCIPRTGFRGAVVVPPCNLLLARGMRTDKNTRHALRAWGPILENG
jgi:hypothetical protein